MESKITPKITTYMGKALPHIPTYYIVLFPTTFCWQPDDEI